MLRRSVTSGTRRRTALLRCCCAPLALALLLGALVQNSQGQAPELGGPANAASDQTAAPTLPPPATPPATVAQPAVPTPPQQEAGASVTVGAESTPAHPSKARDAKASKPTEDL